jgi:hypothetical protein
MFWYADIINKFKKYYFNTFPSKKHFKKQLLNKLNLSKLTLGLFLYQVLKTYIFVFQKCFWNFFFNLLQNKFFSVLHCFDVLILKLNLKKILFQYIFKVKNTLKSNRHYVTKQVLSTQQTNSS